MKKILTFLLLLSANFELIFAQQNELLIRKELSNAVAIFGPVKKDNNGKDCALIEVYIQTNVEIRCSNMKGDVTKSLGKYSFWVSPPKERGKQFFNIVTDKYPPLSVDLWSTEGELKRGYLYKIEIDVPQGVVSQAELEALEKAKKETERKSQQNLLQEQQLREQRRQIQAQEQRMAQEKQEMDERERQIKQKARRQKIMNLGANTVWYNFLEYQYALKSNLGFMYGRCKGLGFYVKAATNSHSADYLHYQNSDEGWYYDKDSRQYYYKTSETEIGDNMSDVQFDHQISEYLSDTISRNNYGFGIKDTHFNAGVMARLGTDVLYFAAGLGYEWYHCDGATFTKADKKGLSYDANLIFRFDANDDGSAFSLMLGYSSPFGSNVSRITNAHIGIGVSF